MWPTDKPPRKRDLENNYRLKKTSGLWANGGKRDYMTR